MYAFKFYSNHILKSKKKHVELILIIFLNLSNISEILFQHVINIKIIRYFTFFLCIIFKIWYVFYTYISIWSIHIQVSNNQVLQATIWDSAGLVLSTFWRPSNCILSIKLHRHHHYSVHYWLPVQHPFSHLRFSQHIYFHWRLSASGLTPSPATGSVWIRDDDMTPY